MSKLELYLSKIVKYGLYAILLTPLAFWPKALYPFLTPKFILFQILVEIVFAAWLALLVLRNTNTRMNTNNTNQNSRHSYDNSYHSYWRKWLITSLFIFIGISFLSAIFGIDFQRSFWGIGARMTGLFAELHFLAWFIVLTSSLRSGSTQIVLSPSIPGILPSPSANSSIPGIRNHPRESAAYPRLTASTYLNFSFAVSILVALTAFYQNTQWHLVPGYTIFSNPTFVAPYFIFHFFWGLYQTINLNRWLRWLFASGTVFLLSVILFAQIRGAILGLLIGIFALGAGLILSGVLSRRSRILLSTFYFLLSISLVGLWYLRDNQFIQSFSPIKRVTGISLFETTVQTRFLAWQIALKGFKSVGWRTLFGTGPENFNYLFNAHYNPRLLKFGGGGFGETWFDKPHNAFLEVLTEVGIIGSLAYVFIWAMTGLALYKLFKKGEKFLSLILASAFIAYFGSVFFSFDSFGSWFGLYLMLGFLASLSIPRIEESAPPRRGGGRILGIRRKFASFVCLFVLFVLLYVNYGIWRANVADADALRTFPRNTEQGVALFKKSLNYFTPYKSEYRLDLFTAVGSAIQTNYPLPDPEETISFALNEADKIIIDHPKDAAYYTNLVKLYDILGEKGRDPQILKIAQSYGDTSLALSPNRQETLFYLTKNSLLIGDAKSAVSYMIQAVNAELSIGLSHWYLGLAYIADNQIDKGDIEIKKALELGYKPQNQKEIDFVKSLGL